MRSAPAPSGRGFLPAVQRLVDAPPEPAHGLPVFFACFAHPEAVEALFLLAETRRVAHRLRGAYPGLRRDLDWLDGLTLPSLLPEALRRVFAGIVPPNGTRAPGREANGDSVYDSACWAAETYARILSALVRVRPEEQDPAAFEAALFEKMTGDALLDPTPDDDAEPPSPAPDLPALELEPEEGEDAGGAPLSPEELEALIEAGLDLHLRQGHVRHAVPARAVRHRPRRQIAGRRGRASRSGRAAAGYRRQRPAWPRQRGSRDVLL